MIYSQPKNMFYIPWFRKLTALYLFSALSTPRSCRQCPSYFWSELAVFSRATFTLCVRTCRSSDSYSTAKLISASSKLFQNCKTSFKHGPPCREAVQQLSNTTHIPNQTQWLFCQEKVFIRTIGSQTLCRIR